MGQIREQSKKKPNASINPGNKNQRLGQIRDKQNTNSGQIQRQQIESPHKSKQQKLKAGNNVETTPKFTTKNAGRQTKIKNKM